MSGAILLFNLDINECENTSLHRCNVGGVCLNLMGSFKCRCSDGYDSGVTEEGLPTCEGKNCCAVRIFHLPFISYCAIKYHAVTRTRLWYGNIIATLGLSISYISRNVSNFLQAVEIFGSYGKEGGI